MNNVSFALYWTSLRNVGWHKFYLSMENSLCDDYITEKFFTILQEYDTVNLIQVQSLPVHNWPYFGRSYAGASENFAVQFYANCFPTLPHLDFKPSLMLAKVVQSISITPQGLLTRLSALECESGGDESGQSVLHPYPRPQQLAQVWQTAEKLISSHHSLWGSSWGGHGWATDLFRCTGMEPPLSRRTWLIPSERRPVLAHRL